jgi:hypothetical protein
MTTKEAAAVDRFLTIVEGRFAERSVIDRKRGVIHCKTPKETLAVFNVMFVGDWSEKYGVSLTLRDEERRILVS